MARTETVYPVYMIAGFLDSGKTSFINGILADGFSLEDRTLLLCCEEGEEAYDPQALHNVTVVTVEDQAALTPQFLLEQQRKCGAEQIIVEYNGMWPIQPFYEEGMPENWVLYQIIFTVEGPTFDLYARNMGPLMLEKLRNADMILINRCDDELCAALRGGTCASSTAGRTSIWRRRTHQRGLHGRHGVRLRPVRGGAADRRRGLRPLVRGDHGQPRHVRGEDGGLPGHDVQAPPSTGTTSPPAASPWSAASRT